MVPTSNRPRRASPANVKTVNTTTATPESLKIAHRSGEHNRLRCLYHWKRDGGMGQAMTAYSVPHNRKGLVVPPAWAAVPVGCSTPLIRGWGMDTEPDIPMLGITWPMGARGAMPPIGIMPALPVGAREDKGSGSLLLEVMLLKPWPVTPIIGLTLIWLRVGGWGWLTWKGLAWGAGAGAVPKISISKEKETNIHLWPESQARCFYQVIVSDKENKNTNSLWICWVKADCTSSKEGIGDRSWLRRLGDQRVQVYQCSIWTQEWLWGFSSWSTWLQIEQVRATRVAGLKGQWWASFAISYEHKPPILMISVRTTLAH